ncbi:MAG: Cobalamin-binding protein precursor [Methanocella sp. PtaU1.Bin125]|nr:MAG: Cobalamin-binding protein precursor [Methanocella sp. PtaU1.Bin125]
MEKELISCALAQKSGGIIIKNRLAIILAACVVLTLALCLAGCTSPTPAPSVTPTPGNNTTAQGLTFTDTNGKTVTLPKPAEKIVVLNSDCAEVLVAIGAKDRIVGVASSVKTNPSVGSLFANVTDVGNWQTPNPEQIALLQPDVIISYASSPPKNADQLTQANATIVQLDCGNLKTIVGDITAMGIITGNVQQAQEYSQYIQSVIDLVKERVAPISATPSVYWEYNKAWSTAGNSSGGDTIMYMAGAANIAGDLGNKTNQQPAVNQEFVLTKNPQIIMKYSGFSVTNTTLAGFSALRNDTMARTGIAGVDAVKNGKVYVISSTIAYGPKAFIGLLYMAKVAHPGAFQDIDPAAKLDEYAGRFVPGTNATIVFYPTPA